MWLTGCQTVYSVQINSKSCSIPSVVELMQLSSISYRRYMRRMQSTTRSPIFTEFAETLTCTDFSAETRSVSTLIQREGLSTAIGMPTISSSNPAVLIWRQRPQHSHPCRPGSIMTGKNVDGLSDLVPRPLAQLQINKLDLFNSFGPSSHPRANYGSPKAHSKQRAMPCLDRPISALL